MHVYFLDKRLKLWEMFNCLNVRTLKSFVFVLTARKTYRTIAIIALIAARVSGFWSNDLELLMHTYIQSDYL